MIYSFLKKKLASSWGAPQENDAKFRFAIHLQEIRQFHDNCKMPDCYHIGAPLDFDNNFVNETAAKTQLLSLLLEELLLFLRELLNHLCYTFIAVFHKPTYLAALLEYFEHFNLNL